MQRRHDVDAGDALAVLPISAVAQRGIDVLTERLWQVLRVADAEDAERDAALR